MLHLGIDIAKETFEVVLLDGEHALRGRFDNHSTGFGKLDRWLKKRCKERPVHACLEATGRYWEELALFLHEQGLAVSVVNPRAIKKYAESKLQRNKTDRADALLIAQYLFRVQPDLWSPPSPATLELRELVRHLQALKADRTRQQNRRQSRGRSAAVLAAVEAHIAFLEEQIAQLEQQINEHIDQHSDLQQNKALLTSIPGVGDVCAAAFMAEVPDISRFDHAGQVAAFAGLTPGQNQSGTSTSGSRLVKWGNAHLRAVFYMPALRAHAWNPIIAALRERLLARGKSKMTVVVAVMRKLIHLCFGVLKTRQPFDAYHALGSQTALDF
jgi:transposase